MELSQEEFESIIADDSKRIVGDIAWRKDPDHRGAFAFAVPVDNAAGRLLRATGWVHLPGRRLSYSLILQATRIAGLDYGKTLRHRNLDGTRIVGDHTQHWLAEANRAEARPLPVGMPDWDDLVAAWRRFCAEVGIVHVGRMRPVDTEAVDR